MLLDYWRLNDVQMALKGQSTSQYDMFIATQIWHGRQIYEMIGRLEAAWQALPEVELTEEAKDNIFHQLFGPESRGRVRCRGKGLTPTLLREISSSATSTSQDLKVLELQHKVERQKEEIAQQQTA